MATDQNAQEEFNKWHDQWRVNKPNPIAEANAWAAFLAGWERGQSGN